MISDDSFWFVGVFIDHAISSSFTQGATMNYSSEKGIEGAGELLSNTVFAADRHLCLLPLSYRQGLIGPVGPETSTTRAYYERTGDPARLFFLPWN